MDPRLNHFEKRQLRIRIVGEFNKAAEEGRIPDFDDMHRRLDVSVRTLKKYYQIFQHDPQAVIDLPDGPHHKYLEWAHDTLEAAFRRLFDSIGPPSPLPTNHCLYRGGEAGIRAAPLDLSRFGADQAPVWGVLPPYVIEKAPARSPLTDASSGSPADNGNDEPKS